MKDSKRDILERQIDVCTWALLEPSFEKANVFLVDPELDFLEVSTQIADDDVEQIKEWVKGGKLRRPTPEAVKMWKQIPDKSFRMVVVKPFLLIQEVMAS